MLKLTFKYENSLGDTLDFNSKELYADPQALMAWELDANTSNDVLTGFSASSGDNDLTCVVPVTENAMEMRDRIQDIPSYDLENSTPGKIYINDWYKAAYISGAEISYWKRSSGVAMFELTITNTEDNYWYKDTTYTFNHTIQSVGEWLDYSYDYAHDYAYGRAQTITNENYIASDLLIRIYGEVSNPAITIGGNTYSVNIDVEDGEVLEIDTRDKSVILYDVVGNSESVFADIGGEYLTGSGSYIFEKLANGEHDVSWAQTFTFDITVHEKRLTPRFTDFEEYEQEEEQATQDEIIVGETDEDSTPTEEAQDV